MSESDVFEISFAEGFHAARSNADPRENPYEKLSLDHRAWHRGFSTFCELREIWIEEGRPERSPEKDA